MKKLITLFFAAACIAGTASAQDCKSVDEKTDKFTGKTSKSANIPVGNLRIKWIVNMSQSEGQTFMKWSIAMVGEYNQKLPTGTVMLVRLEDGTVLNLKTMEETTPITKAITGSGTVNIFSTYNLRFQLSREELTNLSKSPIEDIKIDVPGIDIKNAKLKGNQMGKIQDVSGCLLTTAS